VAGAELAGQDEIAEASLGRRGEHEEDHQGAVEGDQSEVVFGQDGAVEGDRKIGPDQVDAHQQREHRADGDGEDGEQKILDADDVVVGGEEVAAEPGERLGAELGENGAAGGVRRRFVRDVPVGGVLVHWAAAFSLAASQAANWAAGRTRRSACMR
jgi:hypothetical protein